MGFTFGILFFIGRIAVLIFGFRWCQDVFGRLGSDIAILKESDDNADRVVVVVWWVITLGIILLMASVVWSLISRGF